MVQFWSALATRDTRLMTHVLATHFPDRLTNATYATYIRCHDDIGWAVTDEDAAAQGLSGPGHRAFLSDFYEGSFPGTFARGALFQENPATGDKRISGSFASWPGWRRRWTGDPAAQDLGGAAHPAGACADRQLWRHPLIYMGDELALLNDRGFSGTCPTTPMTAAGFTARGWTGRWPTARHDDDRTRGPGVPRHPPHPGPPPRHAGLHAGHPCQILRTEAPGLFAFRREAPTGAILCLFNFTESWQHLPEAWARAEGGQPDA
jgi:amylosucrase